VVEAAARPAGIVGWLDHFGSLIIRALDDLGRFFYIMAPFDGTELMRQMVRVGWDSIPVVFLTCLFTGMVLALQTFRGFERFHAEGFVGSVVALSLTRELAPVLTGLMVAGRVGSAMAAELGTMRVTEQIDALYAMATEPIHYLVVPRVNASILMLPILALVGDAVGIIGGWLVAVGLFGANSYLYMERTFQFLEVNDITSGLIKAAFFGLILSVTGCAKGFYTSGGAEGVGRSTTSAVVTASLYILLSDFFLTLMTTPATSAASSPADPMISVIGLYKSFGEKKVLNGVDLEIGRGESLMLVGGSGAGKSVFIKHLIGLLQPDEGNVVVDGVDLTRASPEAVLELRKRFGMTFQEGALFDSMTVGNNIAFPIRRHTEKSEKEVSARVRECLELVRLPGIEDRMPSELSGGMRRRVGFARAIALEPEILLFDEPTTGLDPINTAAIGAVINQLRTELGVTALTITHDMGLATRIADRVAIMRRGQILLVDTPDRFLESDNWFVRAFLNGEVPQEDHP